MSTEKIERIYKCDRCGKINFEYAPKTFYLEKKKIDSFHFSEGGLAWPATNKPYIEIHGNIKGYTGVYHYCCTCTREMLEEAIQQLDVIEQRDKLKWKGKN